MKEDPPARAAARRSWPVRIYRLAEQPSNDLTSTTTPLQRLEMMWPLALEAWSLSGRPMPEYDRRSSPVRIVRP